MRKTRLAWRGQLAKGAILCAAILFPFGLWNSAAWPQAVSQDPAIERGHKQFQQSCGFCHGPDATGARGPDLVRSPLVAHDVKGDKIGEVIRLGRPDKGMPAMPVTDQQVLDIAAYLHARALEAVRSSGVQARIQSRSCSPATRRPERRFSMELVAAKAVIRPRAIWPPSLPSTRPSISKRACSIPTTSTSSR